MKIIKPHRTITTKTEKEGIQRKVQINNKDELPTVFIIQNQKIFIGHWVSMVDKIFPKNNNKKPHQSIYKAREELKKAILNLWTEKKLIKTLNIKSDDEIQEIEQVFTDKIHPYCRSRKQDDKPPKYPSYWYAKFMGKTLDYPKLDTKDYQRLAQQIYEHLYEKQINKSNNGLLKNRALSIQHNVHHLENLSPDQKRYYEYFANNQLPTKAQLSATYDTYKDTYKLSELIESANNITKRNYRSISRCLYEHYGKIFQKATPKELLASNNETYLYHRMVQAAFQARYKNKKAKNTPLTLEQIHQEAIGIEHNKMLSFAIRLGKVIHYSTRECIQDEQNVTHTTIPSKESIEQSDYWTSSGQTKIKQKEAFVLQWLNVISIANSTLGKLIDPTNSNTDYIYEETFEEHIEKLDGGFDTRFNLIFGEQHNLYTNDKERKKKERKKLMIHLRNTLGHIRNASFHFKDSASFISALEANKIKAGDYDETINDYINTQLEQQKKLVIASFQSAEVATYLSQDQLNLVLTELNNDKNNNVTLPKFSKLLQHNHNIQPTKNNQNKVTNPPPILIPAYHQKDTNKESLCKFIILKQLYQSSFDDWLCAKNNINTLNTHIKEVKNYTTQRATFLHTKDTDLTSRASKVITDLDTNNANPLAYFFSQLYVETARIFAIQDGYKSNREEAQKQSEFITKFNMEFIARSFYSYLVEKNLDFLVQPLQPSKQPQDNKSLDYSVLKSKDQITRSWLYMILHFVPAAFVSNLAQQIKKYHITTGEMSHLEILRAIDLYLSMHNAIQQDTQVLDTNQLTEFYEDNINIKTLFNTAGDTPPIKGLREILRFGNIKLLQHFFATKVTQDDLDNFKTMQANIVDNQKTKQKLHQELIKIDFKRNTPTDEIDEYKQCVKRIAEHKQLKHSIFLHEPLKFHQLLSSVMGRLAGFAHIYERDMYFTMLSLQFANPDITTLATVDTDIFRLLKQLPDGEESNANLHNLLDGIFSVKQYRNIRNNLAHFKYMQHSNFDLAKCINDTRALMSYDRKLKNAISKSIIELCKKEHIDISFKLECEGKGIKLTIKHIETECIYHTFGGKIQHNRKNKVDKRIKEWVYSKKYNIALEKLTN